MTVTKPFVSIITLTHNRKEKVVQLLESLFTQIYDPREIIVIDNASTDGTSQVIKDKFPEVKLFTQTRNNGMVAYNEGFKVAKGDFILVIDDDGIPKNDFWTQKIIDRFLSNPKLAIVCCKISMQDTQEIAQDNPEFRPVGDEQTGYPAAAYNGTGAGIRASALHNVGYYPEYFFRSFLELHLSTRILDAGWEIKYFPTIEVLHDRKTGSVNRVFTYYGIRNYFLYVWSLGPSVLSITKETLRYSGYLSKCVIRNEVSASLVTKSLIDAFLKLPQAIKTRKPISMNTWRELFNIRMREHKNIAE